MSIQAKPFVKWAGGKSRLLGQLLPLVPDRVDAYCEPFLGGGAMFLALQPPGGSSVLGDVNPALMRTYRAVRSHAGPGAIWSTLESYASCHNEEAYQKARVWLNEHAWDEFSGTYALAATFIYLNKTCFNGLWRVNRAGHFNTPIGVKGPIEARLLGSRENLEKICKLLQGVHLIDDADYTLTTDLACDRSFVYLDPPYVGTFSSYTPGGWEAEDHARLLRHATELARRGHDVMVSNSLKAESMYRDAGFHVHHVKVPNTVGGRGAVRGGNGEIVATSYTNYRGV